MIVISNLFPMVLSHHYRSIIISTVVIALLLLLSSCVGRVDTNYDSIFIENNGTLVNAHKSTIEIPKDGGNTVIKVVIPWSSKLSVNTGNDSSWLKADISSLDEPQKYSSADNRLNNETYYMVSIILNAQRNDSNTRSATIALSCPYRDDVCKAEISVKQR